MFTGVSLRTYTTCPGEALSWLCTVENIRFGDAAWNSFETFAESAPNNPVISVLFVSPQDALSRFKV
jgi:hypothetical protein